MSRDWIQTMTGRKFRPFEPAIEAIDIRDVARGLATTCRYRGQIARRDFYSVAEHSVLVSHLVPFEFAREGLMHDAAEAYIGDIPRPIKRQPQLAGFVACEDEIHKVIAQKYGLRVDPTAHAAVKEFDDRILVDEIRALMMDPQLYYEESTWLQGLEATGVRIIGLSPSQAEEYFMERFRALFPEFADRY